MSFLFSIGAAALAIGFANGFQVNFYTDTSCNNYQESWNGNNQGTEGSTFDYNGYLGAVIVVSDDQWTTQFGTSYDPSVCLWYDQTCARGAPSCTYQGYSGQDRGTVTDCLTVDQNVGTLWAGFTVCDAAGFDTDYKRDVNVTAIEYTA
ncbi:hypothetical protein LTR86_004569 [Recurvomyces mirabilis]|nr:hypothetical protein LTR86_004569 [Recurvomyces mirabilis]